MQKTLHELITSGFVLVRLVAIRASGLAFLFLANLVIARHFGAAALGQFQFALAVTMIASTIGRLGQDQLMLRTAVERKANPAGLPVTESLRIAVLLAAMATSAVSIFILVTQLTTGSFAVDGSSTVLLVAMNAAAVPLAVLMVVTETLRGAKRPELAVLMQNTAPQAIFLAGVAGFAVIGWSGGPWLGVGYVASVLLAGIATLFVWKKYGPRNAGQSLRHSVAVQFRKGIGFWAIAVLGVLTVWVDTIFIGLHEDAHQVGIYAAIIRTGALIGTAGQLACAGIVPHLAHYFAARNYATFLRSTLRFQLLLIIMAVPFGAILLLRPDWAMAIWGEHFHEGSALLMIYVAFQLFQLATQIPAQLLLVMRLEWPLAIIHLANLAIKIVLLSILQPLWATAGMVWAAGLSLFISNLMMLALFAWTMRGKLKN